MSLDCRYSEHPIDRLLLCLEGMYVPPLMQTFAFFDESGKLGRSDVTAFGGVLLMAGSQLHAMWQERIARDEVAYFSMKDAMMFGGPFYKWKHDIALHEKRDRVVLDLAALLMKPGVCRVSATVVSESFLALPMPEQKAMGADPQYASFDACVQKLLSDFPDIQIQLACDLAVEYSEKCVRMFNRMRERSNAVKVRTTGICFVDDEVNSGIQAADLVAYCARVKADDSVKPWPLVSEILRLFETQDRTTITALASSSGEWIESGTAEP